MLTGLGDVAGAVAGVDSGFGALGRLILPTKNATITAARIPITHFVPSDQFLRSAMLRSPARDDISYHITRFELQWDHPAGGIGTRRVLIVNAFLSPRGEFEPALPPRH